jgi:tryptophanyl-tRNA synthetase
VLLLESQSKLSIAQDDRGKPIDDRPPADDNGALGDLKLGLFAYPVLQAADILLYK